jgi:hypothetical protein
MARMWGASRDQDESVLRELEEVLAGASVGGLPFFVSVFAFGKLRVDGW